MLGRTTIICLLFILWGWPTSAGAEQVGADSALHQQLQLLEKGLQQQDAQLTSARKKEQALLAERARLDEEVADQRRELAATNHLLPQLRDRLAEQRQEIAMTIEARNLLAHKVRQRLAAAHRTGPSSLLNIFFAADDLIDFLTFQDYLALIKAHDRQLLTVFRNTIADQEADERALTAAEQKLLAALQIAADQEQALDTARRRQNDFLRRIQNEKQLYQQARREIAQSARGLTATLAATTSPVGEPAAGSLRPGQFPTAAQAPDFADQRGELPLPVADGTITTNFGEDISGLLGISSPSRGLGLTAPPGAPVKAVFAGTVAHAAPLEGYGRLIIIDHGAGYFTLLARLGEINVEPGALVQQGQLIGRATLDPTAPGGELYFELRQGVEPLDPRPWFTEQ